MDWVKLSTRYYLDAAVASLPNADAELLFIRGLAYAGAEETGGFIPEQVVSSLTRRRRYAADVEALVARSLWVPCQGHGGLPGFRIARWEDWQEELEALARRRAADRERKRRERERRRKPQVKGVSRDMSATDIETQRESKKTSVGEERARSQSVNAGARTREAVRWLHDRYRLTDDEATQVIEQVRARSREPIRHPVRYLASMKEGDLADIVKAVLDAQEAEADGRVPDEFHDDGMPVDLHHAYLDDGGVCAECALPESNRRHREVS